MGEFVIRDICEAVAEAIKGLDAVKSAANLVCVVENKGDVATEIQKAQSTGVCAVVVATAHTRRAGSGPSTTGTLEVQVEVSEKAAVNRRAHPSGLTAQDAAEAIGEGLHRLALDGFRVVVYDDMRRQDYEASGAAVQNVVVSLHVEQALDREHAVSWGLADGSTVFGEIVRVATSDGSVAVFEPGRAGADTFHGVRNRHLIVDVTANVNASDCDQAPAISDIFSCPARGEVRQFVCTASETTEDVEDVSTIHLRGRTFPGT